MPDQRGIYFISLVLFPISFPPSLWLSLHIQQLWSSPSFLFFSLQQQSDFSTFSEKSFLCSWPPCPPSPTDLLLFSILTAGAFDLALEQLKFFAVFGLALFVVNCLFLRTFFPLDLFCETLIFLVLVPTINLGFGPWLLLFFEAGLTHFRWICFLGIVWDLFRTFLPQFDLKLGLTFGFGFLLQAFCLVGVFGVIFVFLLFFVEFGLFTNFFAFCFSSFSFLSCWRSWVLVSLIISIFSLTWLNFWEFGTGYFFPLCWNPFCRLVHRWQIQPLRATAKVGGIPKIFFRILLLEGNPFCHGRRS